MKTSVNCLPFASPVITAIARLAFTFASKTLSHCLPAPTEIFRPMRSPQLHFPSISLVLSRAQCLMHSPNHLPKRFYQQSVTPLLPVYHDDNMQTMDERNSVPHVGLDVTLPSILETDEELASQQEVLAGNELDDAAVKRKNLIYSLVIALALALKRKFRGFCVKIHKAEADSEASAQNPT
ncbi:hypothetical protein PILCRDRAFT_208813 [Piloderma croceum F 1598]|uniref:Uncharacterized protein n=1 Tax=Piloderma croceum (strain F 1598) TaxID=765440 RepID=A0A0C3FXL2_PILCF|nr:hypothetical protein PILCRDRAFT_208813 [Piloderma croceum F 1598]